MTRSIVPVDRIVGELRARMPELARELLPRGHREDNEWTDAHRSDGGRGDSLKVNLRSGVWGHFATGEGGDALALVRFLLFPGDGTQRRAFAWALGWLGYGGDAEGAPPPIARPPAPAPAAPSKRSNAGPLRIWTRAGPLPGTLSEAYLLSRGIDFGPLGRYPASLRHHGGLPHPETGDVAPVLVAAVTGRDGALTAVHRTFLEQKADGSVGKLSGVAAPKCSYGRIRGGCIRLWRGASGRPLADALPGEELLIGEGIEDTLSAVMVCPELRAVCAVSLGAMGSMWLPRAIGVVTILGQRDPPVDAMGRPHPARLALDRAIAQFRFQGKRVRLAMPPEGRKDLNELLIEEVG